MLSSGNQCTRYAIPQSTINKYWAQTMLAIAVSGPKSVYASLRNLANPLADELALIMELYGYEVE
jgi:hypothetical protein